MVAIKNMKMPNKCGNCSLCGSYNGGHNYCKYTGNRIMDFSKCADDCPLVEIEERKVGKWEHDKLFGECAYVCSFCHTIWTSSEIENMHYCPTCGTEMRGAENG